MVKNKLISVSILFLILFSGLAFALYIQLMDLSKPYIYEEIIYSDTSVISVDTVRIGVISRFPSNILYSGYQPLMDYLSIKTDYYFELIVNTSYSETVQNLASGTVDAAFLGSFIYIASRDYYGLTPILKPVNKDGNPSFRSHIVVREDSDIFHIEDILGKRLALPSEQSFSANWLFNYGFQHYSIVLEDLELVHHLDHHHTVIYEVMRGTYHAGSVKDRVAREFENRGVRIIASSDPVPGSPLVISNKTRPEVSDAIKRTLLAIDIDESVYQTMILNWDPEFLYGFVEANPQDYDVMYEHFGEFLNP